MDVQSRQHLRPATVGTAIPTARLDVCVHVSFGHSKPDTSISNFLPYGMLVLVMELGQ